eukprot:CAMPEP_0113709562 /NCGR_PEP_ID=MMETSP0038_2-20120614/29640_1 /TAXON_ID=2898 /ORGANISM="Cryptomonas paramecium" /LENGTH=292 /DNA_ID=CAMNT_0000635461 /DNA_START=126 /DNA_END=1000 /DNA_ORIENTATION=- /assembly_acc=CAM_ASM_000170
MGCLPSTARQVIISAKQLEKKPSDARSHPKTEFEQWSDNKNEEDRESIHEHHTQDGPKKEIQSNGSTQQQHEVPANNETSGITAPVQKPPSVSVPPANPDGLVSAPQTKPVVRDAQETRILTQPSQSMSKFDPKVIAFDRVPSQEPKKLVPLPAKLVANSLALESFTANVQIGQSMRRLKPMPFLPFQTERVSESREEDTEGMEAALRKWKDGADELLDLTGPCLPDREKQIFNQRPGKPISANLSALSRFIASISRQVSIDLRNNGFRGDGEGSVLVELGSHTSVNSLDLR